MKPPSKDRRKRPPDPRRLRLYRNWVVTEQRGWPLGADWVSARNGNSRMDPFTSRREREGERGRGEKWGEREGRDSEKKKRIWGKAIAGSPWHIKIPVLVKNGHNVCVTLLMKICGLLKEL